MDESRGEVPAVAREEAPAVAPPWLGEYLQQWKVAQDRMDQETVSEESIKLESVLQTEDITITDEFRRSVIAQFKAESLMNAAKKEEIVAMRAEINRSNTVFSDELIPPVFPWDKIPESDIKLISKQGSSTTVLDFSQKSLKAWILVFQDINDRTFLTSSLGRVALVFNSCSNSTKQRLLTMNLATDVLQPEYTFVDLLKTLCVLYLSPNHITLATKSLYKGVRQVAHESIQVYLDRIRVLAEDAFGTSSRWSMTEVLLIISTVVEGVTNKQLSTMVSGYVGQVPFLFNTFRDIVVQYSTRIQTQPTSEINAISGVECFRCGGEHYIRDCKKIQCSKCGAGHKNSECRVPVSKLICEKCPHKLTTQAHWGPARAAVSKEKPKGDFFPLPTLR